MRSNLLLCEHLYQPEIHELAKMRYELFAERAGFEPAIEFPLYTLSRRAPSATRTPLQIFWAAKIQFATQASESFYLLPKHTLHLHTSGALDQYIVAV